jgi:hypothetical protein
LVGNASTEIPTARIKLPEERAERAFFAAMSGAPAPMRHQVAAECAQGKTAKKPVATGDALEMRYLWRNQPKTAKVTHFSTQ